MSKDLKRTLTLQDAISIVAGSMIGCGIFIVSTDISRQVNSGWLLLLVWILSGFITMCGSLSYGELASNMPDEGGQYFYLKKIFNEQLAFVYGWTLLLVIQTGTIAAICIAIAKFIGVIFPIINTHHVFFAFGPFHLTSVQLLAMFAVSFITFINSRGIKAGVVVQNVFTITKLVSIIAILICGIFFGVKWSVISGNFSIAANLPHLNMHTVPAVFTALVGALFASITFNNVTFISSEIKEPSKNIPLALIIGTGSVVLIYILINAVYLGVLPLEQIQNAPEDIVAAALMNSIFGSIGKTIVAIIIGISAFGCANGMILTGSRVYYKMAKDRLLFRGLAVINRKTKVPTNSLWFQCFWIIILMSCGDYSELLDFVIYSSLIFYIITVFGLFLYRAKHARKHSGFRVNSILPVLFIILGAMTITCLSIYKPATTLPGLIISLSGLPVYYFWDKQRTKKSIQTETIENEN